MARTRYRFHKRRVPTRLVLFAVWTLFALAGCKRPAAPSEEKAPPAAVKWEGPLQGALEEWTELLGTTTPCNDRVARITAPVEGRVLSITGESSGSAGLEGQRVEKGAAIVQLDATIVEASLAKADAAHEVLKEEENQARIAVELSTQEVNRLNALKADEDRAGPGTRTLVSPVDRLKAELALKDAQSKLNAARGRLAAGAKEKESLQASLKLHTLSAPIAGRVGRLLVVRGQTLAVGTPVAEVVDLDQEIDVLCFVPPSQVGRLRLGQQALSGGFDAGPAAGPEAEGKIVFIADQAEPETGNFAVKVRFANNDAHLRANRVLRIRVLTSPGRECLTVRESAIQEDDEFPTVVLVLDVKTTTNDEGKTETVGVARRVRAVLGTRDRTLHQVEILKLDDSEKDPARKWQGELKDALFVVQGGQGLQTGDAVKLGEDDD